jgi:hypothetical protein
LLEGLHAIETTGRTVSVEGVLSVETFDRLSVWGASAEDFEDDDALEEDTPREPELHT